MGRILITGGTDGIGLETARQLARRGATVDVHGRSAAKVAAVAAELGGGAAGHVADLTDLEAVRAMCAALRDRGAPIHVLVLNAGLFAKERVTTPDGRESSLAVNHDAHVLLVDELLGLAVRRVVVVSSVAHLRGRLVLGDLDWRDRPFDGYGAYAASKLANAVYAAELARRTPGVSVNSLHPGVITTKLLREGFQMDGYDSLTNGAATSVFLALDAPADLTGAYLAGSRVAAHNPAVDDRALGAQFWDLCRARVGLPASSNPAAAGARAVREEFT